MRRKILTGLAVLVMAWVLAALVLGIRASNESQKMDQEIEENYASEFGADDDIEQYDAGSDERTAMAWWRDYSFGEQSSICLRYASDRTGVLVDINVGGADDYVDDPAVFERLLDREC